MSGPIRTTRRAGVVFVAVASVLLGVGALAAMLEWGATKGLSTPLIAMLLLTVLPAASLAATAADSLVARSDR